MTGSRFFSFDIPPSTNNLYRNLPKFGRVTTTAYNGWKKKAATILGCWPQEMAAPYGIHIRANVNHTRDIDNLAKPILDALTQNGILTGDQWVNTLRVDRDRSVEGCQVEVWSLQEPSA